MSANYNITNYINNISEVNIMNINAIISKFKAGKTYELTPKAHLSVKNNFEEPFYIDSTFTDIHTNKSPKFYIFSAPGATGKSTFAKWLTYKSNGIYWDLSKIRLGHGTFKGIIYDAVGIEMVSQYIKDLRNGDTTLIIDGLDESEMISGRQGLEILLSDINGDLQEVSIPSVVLLSRTETAQFAASFFQANNIPFMHYEIGLFVETKAHEFVRRYIDLEKKLTPALEKCVEGYFNKIKNLSSTNANDKFLRYAPVLHAMALSILNSNNSMHFLDRLTSKGNDIDFVEDIIEHILIREQEKVKAAFKERCNGKKLDFDNWDELYNVKEQLVYLCTYITMGEVDISVDVSTVNSLSEDLLDEYSETLKVFVPQHPFISNSLIAGKNKDSDVAVLDFTNPSFRDYTMAQLLMDDETRDYVDLYYGDICNGIHHPSELMWEHYIKASGDKISGNDLPYLYEAFKAKVKAAEKPTVEIIETDNEVVGVFTIYKKDEVVYEYTCTIDTSNGIYFDSCSNVNIDVNCDIEFGYLQKEIRIVNSSILANNIKINALSVTIESYDSYHTLIAAKGKMSVASKNMTIFDTHGNGNIKIAIPNLNDFSKLFRYRWNLKDKSDDNIIMFMHNLKKIFSVFRAHKKDMPAKDAEYIDFVLLQSSEERKRLFDFLTDKGIIFKDSKEKHLYKIDVKNMSDFGINWNALIMSDEKQLKKVFDEYKKWLGETDEG